MSIEKQENNSSATPGEENADQNNNDKSNHSSDGTQEAEVIEESKPLIDFLNTDFEPEQKTVSQNRIIDETNVEDVEAEEEEEEYDEEKEKKKEYTFEDYKDATDFGIELIDLVLSNSFRALAEEKETSEFELSEKKKEKLSGMLAKILHKHKIKLTIEVMFFLTLIMCYFQIAKKAWSMRKKKNKEKEEAELKEQQNENSGQQQQQSGAEEKRGPGRPRKYTQQQAA